jgi:hypothetical protein
MFVERTATTTRAPYGIGAKDLLYMPQPVELSRQVSPLAGFALNNFAIASTNMSPLAGLRARMEQCKSPTAFPFWLRLAALRASASSAVNHF